MNEKAEAERFGFFAPGGEFLTTLLIFLFGSVLAAGLFFIAADVFKLPTLAAEKALAAAEKQDAKRVKTLDALFRRWAGKLSKYIRMDEYKRAALVRTLPAAGMDTTPEEYTANAIVKTLAMLLLVISQYATWSSQRRQS